MMNMMRGDSVSNLYILPNVENSEKSVIINLPNYPLKHFQLRNGEFLKLVLNKEFHARRSTLGSPCTELHEENYYQVTIKDCFLISSMGQQPLLPVFSFASNPFLTAHADENELHLCQAGRE